MLNLKNQKAITSLSGILIGAVVLLLLSNIATISYLFSQNKKSINEENQKNLEEIQNLDSSKQINEPKFESSNSSIEPTLSNQQNHSREQLKEQPQNLTAGEIYVDWYEWPAIVSIWDIFNYDLVEKAIHAYNSQEENQYNKLTASPEEFVKKFNIYESGVIDKGAFAGDKFYVITALPDGPSWHDPMYRVIYHQEKAIIISKYSDELWQGAIDMTQKQSRQKKKFLLSSLQLITR